MTVSLPASFLNGIALKAKTKQKITVPETPEQSAMAEQANWTIVEIATCLLLQAKLPKTYWLRATATAFYYTNVVSSNKLSKSPFGKFTGKNLQLENAKKFGWTTFVRKRKNLGSWLDEKALKSSFLGYDEHSPGYVVQDLQTNVAFVARNLIFVENEKDFLKSDSDVVFQDFPDIEQLRLPQNPIEMEFREEVTDSQMVPSEEVTNRWVMRVFRNNWNMKMSQETASLRPNRMCRTGKTLKVQILPEI